METQILQSFYATKKNHNVQRNGSSYDTRELLSQRLTKCKLTLI